MFRPQRESFVIRIRGEGLPVHQAKPSPKPNFSSMKIFDRFRKILMRFILSLPSRGSAGTGGSASVSRQKTCDRPDPPKTSCSSYYSSNTHYSEAIADCIEFFNKSSSQEGGVADGRKSDVVV